MVGELDQGIKAAEREAASVADGRDCGTLFGCVRAPLFSSTPPPHPLSPPQKETLPPHHVLVCTLEVTGGDASLANVTTNSHTLGGGGWKSRLIYLQASLICGAVAALGRLRSVWRCSFCCSFSAVALATEGPSLRLLIKKAQDQEGRLARRRDSQVVSSFRPLPPFNS